MQKQDGMSQVSQNDTPAHVSGEVSIDISTADDSAEPAVECAQDRGIMKNIFGSTKPSLSLPTFSSILPKNARVMFTLPAANTAHLNKLEVISSRETAYIRTVEAFAGLYNVIYLVTITCLARYRWSVDPSCTADLCKRSDFRVVVWFNFVSVALFTLVSFLFTLYYVYLARFRVKRHRPEVLWAMILLLPTVVLTNNPLLNIDRIQVFKELHGTASSVFAVLRYVTAAYGVSAVSLYQILKFGSLDRRASLQDEYQHTFYPIRVVLMVFLLIGFFVTAITQRTELSPQPFVALIALARNGEYGIRFSKQTIASVVTIGLLQLFFFGLFLSRFRIVSKRVVRRSYQEMRFKAMSVFFLLKHMIVPLTVAMVVTAACSAVFPAPLTSVRRARGHLTEKIVLDMPYYARSGIVLVYCAYACIESFVMLPAVYKPTFLEQVLIDRLGVQAGCALAPPPQQGDASDDVADQSRSTGASTSENGAVENSTIVCDSVENRRSLGTSQGANNGTDKQKHKHVRGQKRDVSSQTYSSVAPLAPVVLQTRRDQNGRVIRGPELFMQFRFDEAVLAFNMSWLVYFSDAGIIVSALAEHACGRYSLRRTWHETTRDLFIMTVSSEDLVIIAVRGSVSMTNLKLNMHMTQARHRPLEDPEWLQGRWKPPGWGSKNPAIHKGFDLAYNSLRDGILEDIRKSLSEIPSRRVFLTGHSLGAAIATLCAFDCRLTLGIAEDRCTLITFGSPRVGNQSFTRRFAVVVPDCWRVLNRRDFITNNPRRFLRGYEHVPRGVLIDDSGNLVLDPMFADLKLFHGNSFRPHVMEAYRKSLQAFICEAYSSSSTFGDGPVEREKQPFKPDFWDLSKYEGAHPVQKDGILGQMEVVQLSTSSFSGVEPVVECCTPTPDASFPCSENPKVEEIVDGSPSKTSSIEQRKDSRSEFAGHQQLSVDGSDIIYAKPPAEDRAATRLAVSNSAESDMAVRKRSLRLLDQLHVLGRDPFKCFDGTCQALLNSPKDNDSRS